MGGGNSEGSDCNEEDRLRNQQTIQWLNKQLLSSVNLIPVRSFEMVLDSAKYTNDNKGQTKSLKTSLSVYSWAGLQHVSLILVRFLNISELIESTIHTLVYRGDTTMPIWCTQRCLYGALNDAYMVHSTMPIWCTQRCLYGALNDAYMVH